MRTAPLALAAALSATLLQACSGGESDPEPCSDPTPVAVVGLEHLANLRLVEDPLSRADVDVYIAGRDENTGRTVPVNEYLMAVTMSAVVAESPRWGDRSALDRFVGATHASCAPPSTTVSQRVSDIDVVSDAPLSSDLPAGTSLKAVTNLHSRFSSFAQDTIYSRPVRDFAEVRSDAELPSLEAFLANEPRAPLSFDLLLDVEVDETREHRFTVTYELDNGDVFTATSDPVTLSPAN